MKKRFLGIVALVSVTAICLSSCSMGEGIFGGGDTGSDSLQYSVTDTQKKLKDLSADGFEITVNFTSKDTDNVEETSTIVFGMMDNIYWNIDEDGEGVAFLISDDKDYAYGYSTYNDEWEYNYKMPLASDDLSTFEMYFGLSGWLYMGHEYDGSLKKSGTTTVAGRKCDVYKYSMNILIEKVEYTLAVDQATGVTMKYDLGAAAYGQSASAGFEVTSFKTNNVKVPELPEPTKEDDPYGNDPNDKPINQNKYERETSICYQSELYTSNDLIVAKYNGNLEDDDLWVDDYGTNDIYYVWSGIKEDGSLDRVGGYCCLYYFYDNESDYLAALSSVKSYNLRGKNDNYYYFTVRTYDIDAESYEEACELFTTGGDYMHPNFYLVD